MDVGLAPISCGIVPQTPMVTISSDAVGCIATNKSKSALVHPIFIATLKNLQIRLLAHCTFAILTHATLSNNWSRIRLIRLAGNKVFQI
jgi:hypothetical protein